MPPFYPIAYAIVILSVTAYSLAPSPSSDEEKSQPYDEERSPLIVHALV
jgi:solute carrier family 35 protein F1/2